MSQKSTVQIPTAFKGVICTILTHKLDWLLQNHWGTDCFWGVCVCTRCSR